MSTSQFLKETTDEWLKDKIDHCRSCGRAGIKLVGEPLEDTSQWLDLPLEDIELEYGTRYPN